MGSYAISAQPAQYRLKPKLFRQIQAQVILGSPSNNCIGVGICRVLSNAAKVDALKCPIYKATIGLTEKEGCCIKFLRAGFDEKMFRRHFRWNLFQLPETYDFPPNICRSLKVRSLILAPGVYPVLMSDKYLTVVIDAVCQA